MFGTSTNPSSSSPSTTIRSTGTEHRTDVALATVGTALTVAGTTLVTLTSAATGALAPSATTVLGPFGAALLAAGLLIALSAVALSGRRLVAVGAGLIAGGVIAAVLGGSWAPAVATPLAACGAALATAGIVTVVRGAATLRGGRSATAQTTTA